MQMDVFIMQLSRHPAHGYCRWNVCMYWCLNHRVSTTAARIPPADANAYGRHTPWLA